MCVFSFKDQLVAAVSCFHWSKWSRVATLASLFRVITSFLLVSRQQLMATPPKLGRGQQLTATPPNIGGGLEKSQRALIMSLAPAWPLLST